MQTGKPRWLVVGAAALALVTGTLATATVRADEPEVEREARAASHTPDPPRVVILARADEPVDALAASAVAAQLGGTVLLTPRDELGDAAVEGIGELLPDVVVLAGGEAALSQQVRQEAQDLAAQPEVAFTVERVAGANRMATAAALGRYFVDTVPHYLELRERTELNRVASETAGTADLVELEAGDTEAVLRADVSAMPTGWLDISGGTEVETDDSTGFACWLRVDGQDVAGSRRQALSDNPGGTDGDASGFGGCQTNATVLLEPDTDEVELIVDAPVSLSALECSLTARFVPHDAAGHRP